MYNKNMDSTVPELDFLPAHVRDALEAIWAGAKADAVESEVLEFKEGA